MKTNLRFVVSLFAAASVGCGGKTDGPAGSDAGLIGDDGVCTACGARLVAALPSVRQLAETSNGLMAFADGKVVTIGGEGTPETIGASGLVVDGVSVAGGRVYWVEPESPSVFAIDLTKKTKLEFKMRVQPRGVGGFDTGFVVTLQGSSQPEIFDLSGVLVQPIGPVFGRDPGAIFARGERYAWGDFGGTNPENGAVYLVSSGVDKMNLALATSIRNLRAVSAGRNRLCWATANGSITAATFEPGGSGYTNDILATSLGPVQAFAADDDAAFVAVAASPRGSKIIRIDASGTRTVAVTKNDVVSLLVGVTDVFWSDDLAIHAVRRDCPC